ncbi:MAG: hypothetical protein ABR976_10665 [Terracidiphilus sp.]|jgi:hypothetical protein
MGILRELASGNGADAVRIRLALAAALLLVLPGGAQSGLQIPHPPNQPIPPQVGSGIDNGNEDSEVQEKRFKALNAERHKSMVADTNRLLKLAGELNAELADEPAESLNPDQLRKVAEIEKLAHSVKEKMGMSVKGLPVFVPSPARFQ